MTAVDQAAVTWFIWVNGGNLLRSKVAIAVYKRGAAPLFWRSKFLAAISVWVLISLVLLNNSHQLPVDAHAWVMENPAKRLILSRAESPRLIVVGGSNVAYNVDSPELSRAIGMHVVNMGVHFGLGLAFLLRQVEPYLRPGDVVLLIPEYENFYGTTFGNETLLAYSCRDPDSFRYIQTPEQWLKLTAFFWRLVRASYFWNSERIWRNVAKVEMALLELRFEAGWMADFRRKLQPNHLPQPVSFDPEGHFEANGDVGRHFALPPDGYLMPDLDLEKPFDGRCAIAEIDRFARLAKTKHVTVLMTYPAVPAEFYAIHRHRIAQVDQLLRKENLPIELLGRPEEFLFPKSYFLDSCYHLRPPYKDLNVEKLIRLLSCLKKPVQATSRADSR